MRLQLEKVCDSVMKIIDIYIYIFVLVISVLDFLLFTSNLLVRSSEADILQPTEELDGFYCSVVALSTHYICYSVGARKSRAIYNTLVAEIYIL